MAGVRLRVQRLAGARAILPAAHHAPLAALLRLAALLQVSAHFAPTLACRRAHLLSPPFRLNSLPLSFAPPTLPLISSRLQLSPPGGAWHARLSHPHPPLSLSPSLSPPTPSIPHLSFPPFPLAPPPVLLPGERGHSCPPFDLVNSAGMKLVVRGASPKRSCPPLFHPPSARIPGTDVVPMVYGNLLMKLCEPPRLLSSASLVFEPRPHLSSAVRGQQQYSGTCFIVEFESLLIKMGLGRNNIAKLTTRDDNPQFPEVRAVVVSLPACLSHGLTTCHVDHYLPCGFHCLATWAHCLPCGFTVCHVPPVDFVVKAACAVEGHTGVACACHMCSLLA
ncbi:unnamed protein product [Closterium sp. Naga37s-1]|nr:unnamed protein product [Closterium sp. Naga37s-1]